MTKKYLYAIHAPSAGRVQIGTSQDPEARVRQLQSASPVELVLLWARESTPAAEERIREDYDDLRVLGDWYSEEILRKLAVNGLAQITADPVTYTDKQLKMMDRAFDWFEHEGRPPTAWDWRAVEGTPWPSYLTCIRHFGSWDGFIFACGWEPRGRGRPAGRAKKK